MLSVQDLSIYFGDKRVLECISFDIPRGSITCIMGKSGVGKSTLLECITQLRTNYKGTITLNGENLKMLPPYKRAALIGLVFQQFNLFPHLTVLENCMQPLLIVQKMSKREAREAALLLLTSLGLEEYKDAYPNQLSGGQQQRVAIARALVLKPQLVCLDEPTSSLDEENSLLLIQELKKLSSQGLTILCTSHDKSFVQALTENVIML